MELKEAIQISLTYLGDEDASVNNKTAQHPRLKLLVKCANLVIKEIATDFIPLIETEQVNAEDIVRLAAVMYAHGQTVDPHLAAPLYVRNRVALTIEERRAGEKL